MIRQTLAIIALVILLRLPFLHQAIQGDDLDYLYGAEHAQIDPLHPLNTHYMFSGDMVDMRGHSHGPGNPWILAILLAAMGDVREVQFHLAYTLLSIVAALAMWFLARRFCERPFAATLLFIAVPAFVVNGNSFEADLPFLAFWMASVALFVKAVDDDSVVALAGSAIAAAFAGLTAYQAILLTPVLAVYLLQRRRKWYPAWAVALAAPLAIAVWQLWEWKTRGALPAAVLMGYMRSYSFNKTSNTLRSAVALVVHSGWILSPLLVFAAFWPKPSWPNQRWRLLVAAGAMLAAAFYDLNPLFWLSVGCGVLVLSWLLAEALRRDFVAAWATIFFLGALLIFFAGSARYLLPIAAPVAILAARKAEPRWLYAGFALQMILSLGLATANYQHWAAYREFAKTLAPEAAQHRVWVDSEWGLRYYLESEGALPLARDQVLQPGDTVVSSTLAHAVTVNAPIAQVSAAEIVPSIPLRLISLSRRSAYSSAAGGLLPFEISHGTVDRVRADTIVDRKPVLSYFKPQDPQASAHILSGLFPDGWMSERASVLLKTPEKVNSIEVVFFIPPNAPARHVQLLVDGQLIAEDTFPAPGPYKLTVPLQSSNPMATVSVTVDKTFSAPGDRRNLGMVVTGVGFR